MTAETALVGLILVLEDNNLFCFAVAFHSSRHADTGNIGSAYGHLVVAADKEHLVEGHGRTRFKTELFNLDRVARCHSILLAASIIAYINIFLLSLAAGTFRFSTRAMRNNVAILAALVQFVNENLKKTANLPQLFSTHLSQQNAFMIVPDKIFIKTTIKVCFHRTCEFRGESVIF